MVPGPPGPHATGIPHPAIVNPQIKHEPPHETDIMHMWVLQAQKFSLGHTLHRPAVGPFFLFSRLEQIISEGMCSSDNIPMPRLASGLTTPTAHTGLTRVKQHPQWMRWKLLAGLWSACGWHFHYSCPSSAGTALVSKRLSESESTVISRSLWKFEHLVLSQGSVAATIGWRIPPHDGAQLHMIKEEMALKPPCAASRLAKREPSDDFNARHHSFLPLRFIHLFFFSKTLQSPFFFLHLRFLFNRKPQHEQRKEQEPKKPHIKKPLNAFMLYMKEMRANVVAECTLKESAAINQILGRRVGQIADANFVSLVFSTSAYLHRFI